MAQASRGPADGSEPRRHPAENRAAARFREARGGASPSALLGQALRFPHGAKWSTERRTVGGLLLHLKLLMAIRRPSTQLQPLRADNYQGGQQA